MDYNHRFPGVRIIPSQKDSNAYLKELASAGIACINVGTHFSNTEYIELMQTLGKPLPESAAVDSTYVEDKVILNIKTDVDTNISTENEPFSISGLRLHVERAFSPQAIQPNYLALYCLVAPQDENGGQTIVYSMRDLKQYFSEEELEILAYCYPMTADITSENPIYAYDTQRSLHYFSYRDLGTYERDWKLQERLELQRIAPETLAKLMKKISDTLYNKEHIYALAWNPGLLYIFDNKKFFHARTEQHAICARHLKRIRVV